MTRVAAIAVLLALLAACGGERAPARSSSAARPAPAGSETLPPEVAQLLRQGPGGSPFDDGPDLDFDLAGEHPIALRIVLEPPARP